MILIPPIAVTPAMIISSNVPETDYPAWDNITAYTPGVRCISNHHIYECATGNTNYLPEDNLTGTPAKWIYCGYVNRYKMFDEIVGSATAQAEFIEHTLTIGMIDSAVFMDCDATVIDFVMTDPVEGVVYEEHIDLIAKTHIVDAWKYFFTPIITKTAVVLLGIPPYSNASIAITIRKPGGIAKCGTTAFGTQIDLGLTDYKPSIGIDDYSKKEITGLGVTLKKGNFSKTMSCQVYLNDDQVDYINDALIDHRSTPVVWVGAESYSSMIIYGFYNDFKTTLHSKNDSRCVLDIEGLI